VSVTDDMRELLGRMYDSFASGDPTVWTDNVADDVLGIGTDADEWWEGRSLIAKVVTTQVQEMSSGGVRLTSGRPQIGSYGDVVWSVDRPVLHLSDGTETPLRVTAIAVSAHGSLQLKHFHYSIGSVNAEVFQQELTTK
jgi:SnoaL-like protein